MTWADSTSSIFDSFNARNLAPPEVAKTFIPPKQFDDLVKRSHSLIIGPRGSGKTTLLKMLQPSALEAWDHQKADYYRSQIDYTGVFIPADVSWGAQIEQLGKGKVPDDIKELVNNSAFTTHVLLSFVEALTDRCALGKSTHRFRYVNLSKELEVRLVKELSSAWSLCPDIPNLLNLKLSLRKRLLDLSSIVNKFIHLHDKKHIEEQNFLFLDFIRAISIGIDIVNAISGSPYEKWALLFDELEIAPKSIRKILLTSIRSVDDRILFKLSISPYNEDLLLLENSISAMAGEDYSPITLWYTSSKDSRDFSHALFKKMLEDFNCRKVEPEDVFGHTPLDQDDGEYFSQKKYSPDSLKIQEFKELSVTDNSFRKYLERHRINLNNVNLMSERDRAQYIRKIVNIVTVRVNYRGTTDSQGVRSRKNLGLYTGSATLFAIAEGNPRWFIGIMARTMREYSETYKRISKSRQSVEIEKAITRFRSLLKTISIYSGTTNPPKDLLFFLDNVGTYFFDNVVRHDFNPEPPLTFIVDKNADEKICDAIGKALNAGALVYIPESEGASTLSNLRGKRFRLSFLLAPHYKLPLVLGKSILLSKILFDKGNIQESLFEGF